MGLKRMLNGNWFTRLVLISWIVCAVSILVVFKNMELIVHGQLYYYGLKFNAEWADPYRILTWLLFVCLGIPMALSGVALISSFFKFEQSPKREPVAPHKIGPQPSVVKTGTPPIAKQIPKSFESGNIASNNGIICPQCSKVFGRALVMLDFRGGKNRMVSVCPYCNKVLGYTSEEKGTNEASHVATLDKK